MVRAPSSLPEMPTSPRSVTSAQGLQALPGVAVQLLHAGRPGGREEDVSLLVPRCTVVHAQLALDVQVGDSCKTKEENRALSIRSFQLCIWQTLGRDRGGVWVEWSRNPDCCIHKRSLLTAGGRSEVYDTDRIDTDRAPKPRGGRPRDTNHLSATSQFPLYTLTSHCLTRLFVNLDKPLASHASGWGEGLPSKKAEKSLRSERKSLPQLQSSGRRPSEL